jgi:hypothetical protein
VVDEFLKGMEPEDAAAAEAKGYSEDERCSSYVEFHRRDLGCHLSQHQPRRIAVPASWG